MSLISAIGQLLSMEAPILRWSQRSFKNHSLVSERGVIGFLFCGEAASSLPSPLGKGDRAAVDRVLSQAAYLRRSFPLFFIPLVPYPARSARHLPHAGKALSVVILFPHMRVFVLTMREKRYSRFVAFPIGEGGPRQRWIGCSRKRRT